LRGKSGNENNQNFYDVNVKDLHDPNEVALNQKTENQIKKQRSMES